VNNEFNYDPEANTFRTLWYLKN